MSSQQSTKAKMILLALLVALTMKFVVIHEIGPETPTRAGLFRIELCVLGLILAGFAAEEVVGLVSGAERRLGHRIISLCYLFAAFVTSVLIYGFLVRILNLPA